MLAFSNDYYGFIFRATQSVELFCAYDKMIFITTSDFSSAAISYAEEVEVKLINGNKLMELLHKQGFIEKEKVKINVMECQLETADLYPYVPRDIYENFFE